MAKLGKSGSGVDFILQHDALSWFFHDAGLSVMGVLQEEADEPPSAAALGALVKKMKEGKKRCIVVTEPQFPERVARSLARDAAPDSSHLIPWLPVRPIRLPDTMKSYGRQCRSAHKSPQGRREVI